VPAHRPEIREGLPSPAPLWIAVLVGVGALPAVALMDRSLMSFIQAWPWPPFLHLMQLLTWLGYGAIDIGALLTIALVGWWGDRADVRTQGLWGAGTVAAAGLMDQIVKNVACRARPSAPQAGLFFAKFPCFQTSYAYASFPSGHATTAFAAAVILAFLYPRGACVFVGLAVLVGLSRVALGAHFPSDVLAGATLGSGFALAATRFVPGIRRLDPAAPLASL
jgi:membrane-associated phospholipid phosphatase